ncbi:MAG: MFS transporter, partial [Chitinophagales bacterium]
LWGVSLSSLHILLLPYIIRNADPDTHTEAISLNAASWSASMIIVGFFNFGLTQLIGEWFGDDRLLDKRLLQLYAILGFFGVFFILKMTKNEKIGEKTQTFHHALRAYDWGLILRAAFPVWMIAVGAGLTIPFINLFFFNVFGMGSDQFSLLGAATAVMVASTILLAPTIKRRFGYEAITVTQTCAVLALLLLAISDFISYLPVALYLAIFCYFIRQPLMNLANPMTSEVTMYYVGKKNQELMSAISSSIWSGSWFFSSQIFRFLREMDLRYGTIFVITAFMYMLAVITYFFLIKDFRKRERVGLLD